MTMTNSGFTRELEQRIAGKRAQREELEREIRNFQDTLNILLRDVGRPDSRAMPSVLYEATEPDEPPPEPEHGYGLLPVLRVSPASLPQYKEWTISFQVIKTMIDVLLQERPLRRRVILRRLAELGLNDPPANDFPNLVSHYLSKDPRFVRCYENGVWTLADWAVAMGPVEQIET
jgi:hypothetical protein